MKRFGPTNKGLLTPTKLKYIKNSKRLYTCVGGPFAGKQILGDIADINVSTANFRLKSFYGFYEQEREKDNKMHWRSLTCKKE